MSKSIEERLAAFEAKLQALTEENTALRERLAEIDPPSSVAGVSHARRMEILEMAKMGPEYAKMLSREHSKQTRAQKRKRSQPCKRKNSKAA